MLSKPEFGRRVSGHTRAETVVSRESRAAPAPIRMAKFVPARPDWQGELSRSGPGLNKIPMVLDHIDQNIADAAWPELTWFKLT
jgi:hypothetical protein